MTLCNLWRFSFSSFCKKCLLHVPISCIRLVTDCINYLVFQLQLFLFYLLSSVVLLQMTSLAQEFVESFLSVGRSLTSTSLRLLKPASNKGDLHNRNCLVWAMDLYKDVMLKGTLILIGLTVLSQRSNDICNAPNKSYWAVLSRNTVYHSAQDSSKWIKPLRMPYPVFWSSVPCESVGFSIFKISSENLTVNF